MIEHKIKIIPTQNYNKIAPTTIKFQINKMWVKWNKLIQGKIGKYIIFNIFISVNKQKNYVF